MNILQAKKINKFFQTGDQKIHILKDISLTIREGDFLTIMGPSGSGKSTLLYALSAMDQVDSGQILLREKDIGKMTEEEASLMRLNTMGFVFQSPSMIKSLNLIDNICLVAYKQQKKNREEIYAKAEQFMEKTGIDYLKDRAVNKVSGGELQRAAICRALMNDPLIIFGDEPTGALNSKSSEEIIQLFKELNEEGKTIVLVTHDPKVAIASKKVLFLRDGRIEEEVNLENLSSAQRRNRVLDTMKALNI